VASDAFDLARFVDAQAEVFAQVRRELESARKRSHWMWFVFPQLRGLGRSAMAQRYGLSDLRAAAAYLQHPVLGPRLIECTLLVNRAAASSIQAIFDPPDDLKFRSCMTLFAALPAAPEGFARALQRFFAGSGDPLTLEALDRAGTLDLSSAPVNRTGTPLDE
jgi:uncharacterized protein (DUF1810 family)